MATGTGLQSFNTTVPSAQDENLTALGHRKFLSFKVNQNLHDNKPSQNKPPTFHTLIKRNLKQNTKLGIHQMNRKYDTVHKPHHQVASYNNITTINN